MWSKLLKMKTLLFAVVVVALIAALACAAEEPEAPAAPAAPAPAVAPQPVAPTGAPAAAPAPAAPRAPAQPAPAKAPAQPKPAAAPEAPQAPSPIRPTAGVAPTAPGAPKQPAKPAKPQPAREGAAPQAPKPIAAPTAPETGLPVGYHYVAPVLEPGGYPDWQCTGCPRPTKFHESPMSAELVRQGKLPPVEERLPVPEDVQIYPVWDEIGTYGGDMRWTSTSRASHSNTCCKSYGLAMDAEGLRLVPSLFRDFVTSEDGREFTFKIRKGMRWHDGYPSTMEDVRFALEDLMLNKELMPGLPPVLRSPTTGNDMKVKFVDDTTFVVSFDDPNFSLAESSAMNIYSGIKGCPRCFITPSHVMKRFHIKYNAAEIPALLEKYDQPNWTKLFLWARNARAHTGVPSETIPRDFDINYIYKGDKHYLPWTGGWVATKYSDAQNILERNHYFVGVDPMGNQLPYMDRLVGFTVESRDVSVFRMMNGENDYGKRNMILSEMPLYLANMTKGDYSLYRHLSPDGADPAVVLGVEYVEDPEIGALLRTQDFRIALSLATNRDAINEIAASGLGIPQNMVPHRATPYYPGDKWQTLHTEFDLDGARALMKKMGYEDKDGDGFFDRKDGTGPLEMFAETTSAYYPYLELQAAQWERFGIKMQIKEGPPYAGFRNVVQTEYFEYFASTEGGTNPWSSGNQRIVAIALHQGAPAIGQYYQTRGEQGMAPTGPDPLYTDAYGNMAPDFTYPADISGNQLKLQDLLTEGWSESMLSPKRIELGKQLFQINVEEQYKLGILGFSGNFRAMRNKRNNVRNATKNWSPASGEPFEILYFEDGIDNLNHPGNRSKKYKSVSFLDADYWVPGR